MRVRGKEASYNRLAARLAKIRRFHPTLTRIVEGDRPPLPTLDDAVDESNHFINNLEYTENNSLSGIVGDNRRVNNISGAKIAENTCLNRRHSSDGVYRQSNYKNKYQTQ